MANKKILVVDDEKELLELVKLRLEPSGYSIITASDGLEGLEKAKTERPDLIILDLMLPKMNGYEVCRLLKFDIEYKKIPIILFTARASDEDQATGIKSGADAYVVKPFNSKILLEKIKELIK